MNVKNKVYNIVCEQAIDKMGGQIRTNIWNQVYNQVWDQVWIEVLIPTQRQLLEKYGGRII